MPPKTAASQEVIRLSLVVLEPGKKLHDPIRKSLNATDFVTKFEATAEREITLCGSRVTVKGPHGKVHFDLGKAEFALEPPPSPPTEQPEGTP